MTPLAALVEEMRARALGEYARGRPELASAWNEAAALVKERLEDD